MTVQHQADTPGDSGAVPSRPDLLARVVRGASLTTLGAVVNAALTFALTVVIARSLGAAGSGLLFTGTALFTTLTVLAKLGADTGLVRELSRQKASGVSGDLGRLVVLAVAPVLLLTLAIAASTWFLADELAALVFDRETDGRAVLRVLALAIPLGSLSIVVVAASRALGDIVPLVVVENIGKAVLRLALCVAVAAAAGGVLAMAWAWTLPVMVGGAVTAALLLRRLRATVAQLASSPPTAWPELARPFWRFSALRGVAAGVDVANASLGVLLVSALASSAEAAIFAGSMRYAVAGTLALQAMRLVMAPQISALLARSDASGVEALHRTTTLLAVLLTAPLYVVLALHAGAALSLLGEDFRRGGAVLAVLALAMLFNLATGNVQAVLLMGGRSGVNLLAVGAGFAVNLVLCVVLVPVVGALGAALAWAAAMCLENLWYAEYVRRRMSIGTFHRPLVVALAAVLGCFAVPALVLSRLLGESLAVIGLGLLVSVAAYLFVLHRQRSSLAYASLLSALRPRGRTTAGDRP